MTNPPSAAESASTDPSGFKYWAFISYSSKDRAWGEWLIKSIEGYWTPRAFVGRPTTRGEPVPRRAYPIFRDRDELPTDTDLGGAIHRALEQSRYLIVICSPNSAASRWVNQEILTFKRLGRENRVLSLIVDGSPNASDDPAKDPKLECYPHALRFALGPDGNLSAERTHPISADARERGDGKRNSLLKMLAGVLGVNYDDLKQRDATRRRRQRAIWCAAAMLVTAGMAWLALNWQNQKALNASAAMALASLDATKEHQAAKALELALAAIPGGQGPGSAAVAPLALVALTRASTSQHLLDVNFETVVQRLQYSPDGKFLLVFSVNHAVLYSSDGRNALRALEVSEGILDADISGDGTRILLLHPDAISEWDPATGNRLRRTRIVGGHIGGSLRLSADGRHALVFGRENSKGGRPPRDHLAVYSMPDFALVLDRPAPAEIGDARFTPDGTMLLAGLDDGRILGWRLKEVEPSLNWQAHKYPVAVLSISPDGRRLASVAVDNFSPGPVRLWHLPDGAAEGDIGVWAAAGPGEPLNETEKFIWAGFASDTSLVTVSENHVRLWDVAQRRETGHLEDGISHSATFASPAGFAAVDAATSRLVTSGGSSVAFWTLQSARQTVVRPFLIDALQRVEASADGRRFACVANDWTTVLFDVPQNRVVARLPALFSFDAPLQVSPDVGRVWLGTNDGESMFEVATGKSHSGAMPQPAALDWSTDRVAYFDGADNRRLTIALRNAPGTPLASISLPSQGYRAQFLPDGRRIATLGMDHTVRIWDAGTGALRLTYQKHEADMKIVILSFDRSGARALSGTMGGKIHVWDTSSGADLGAWKGDNDYTAGALGEDGTQALIAEGSVVLLFDVNQGKVLARFSGLETDTPAGRVISVGFLEKGRRAFAASSSGELRIFDLPPPVAELLAHAREVNAGRTGSTAK